MTVTVEDIFAVGTLLSAQDDEASRRAAIGRHYYALYHAAKSWHGSLPIQGAAKRGDVGVHMKLVEQLGNPAAGLDKGLARLSRKLSAKLDVARMRRTRADYQLADLVTAEMMSTHSLSVRRILDELAALATTTSTTGTAVESACGESVGPSSDPSDSGPPPDGPKTTLVRIK